MKKPRTPTTPQCSVLVLAEPPPVPAIGSSLDKGCVGCGHVAMDGNRLVRDARARYWHFACAAEALSSHPYPKNPSSFLEEWAD